MKHILQFLNAHPRNRLIIVKDKSIDIPYLDVGRQLSKMLQNQTEDRLSNHALESLNNLLKSNVLTSKELERYISIENLGILMEKELKLDLKTILKNYSRGTTLIVKWPGEVVNNRIYFLTQEEGVEINLKDISHIII
ncbi:MAG TPA: hypothetical protein VK050_11420 [Flavobacteriaceae bacterium]|nr:hypothetical protein [Flavobacteriaceae bacterium]